METNNLKNDSGEIPENQLKMMAYHLLKPLKISVSASTRAGTRIIQTGRPSTSSFRGI